LALAFAALWPAASAEAGVLELTGQVHSGGLLGVGFFGDRKDDAFHTGASGFGYGALIGLELLFIDGWIEHNQYHDGDRVHGTWTQFLIGADVQFDLGDGVGPPGQEGSVPPKGFGEIGLAVGFGVGTGRQVDPPLDNAEVTDKGFVGQVHLDVGYKLTRVLSVGLHIPVGAGYFVKSGAGATANDLGTHYGSLQAAALLTLRTTLGL
jgi:hypothetical protein